MNIGSSGQAGVRQLFLPRTGNLAAAPAPGHQQRAETEADISVAERLLRTPLCASLPKIYVTWQGLSLPDL